MKKLLMTLLATGCVANVFASSFSFPVQCNNSVTLTAESTLADVQKCVISKQKTSDGLYVVEFKDINNNSHTCKFASNTPTAVINTCK